MLRVRDWLIDLAEHNYVDIIEKEVVILPIKKDGDKNEKLEK